ncbi:DUF4168 domain-containing protein [Pontibacter flavimaris]|uniref:DUF4168 domain-containing protein n=1 Tax=Pontibacter flavimaris TaxID=1797110 RepID=A0A1Q5PEL6_9BACT|nr:DUF4168 domain-containing protein [Pontibacter flavimaris]OKL40685.1 hypothetical protein A3841_12560 [Pontibacter flavimaris]
MNFMQNLKGAALAALICGAVLAAPAAMARQTAPQAQPAQPQNFSDADLQQFADASARLITIQQEGEKAMMGILEEEKLSVDKFNQMAQAHQQQKLSEVEATPEEMAAFNNAAQRLMEMQPTLQKDLETAIQQDGMTLEKFEQIMLAYRQDQAVQQRIDLLMQEKQN